MRCNSGMSYIQLLLASSVIAGLAVVGLKMMENQERLAKLTSQRFETSYLVNEMKHILKDPRNCRASLSGLNPKKSVRSINSLKKELRGGKYKEATYYLKYFTFDSSKKLYGQNNIKIVSYALSDENEGVDVNRGSTNLEVTFQSFDKNEDGSIRKRLIPLRIRIEDELIADCELFNNSVGGKSSKESYYAGKGLHVGDKSPSAGLSTFSELTLIPSKEDKPECNSSTRGGLIYDEKSDEVYFCSTSDTWSTLGQFSGQSSGELYRVNAMDGTTHSLKTKRHRFCIVREIKSNEKGNCQVIQQEGVGLRNWKIFAEFTSPRGGQFCEAECFN